MEGVFANLCFYDALWLYPFSVSQQKATPGLLVAVWPAILKRHL